MAAERKSHWEQIYRTRAPTELSWHQTSLDTSCELIAATGVSPAAPILDVGAGASLLVDTLLEAGFSDLTVLDIAPAALQRVRERLGAKAESVMFVEADVTDFRPSRRFALWHDRAVFHFLTDPADRRRYRLTLTRALQSGGHVIIATFALTGPTCCSGLDVVGYSAATLAAELGEGLALVESFTQTHITPAGREQQFLYCRFRARPVGGRHG
jgi:SAM-dependent methyltransferase